MSNGLLIINAADVDVKIINRLLLHIRDWEYGDDPHWDQQHVAFLRDDANLPNARSRDRPDEEILKPTVPSLQPPLPDNQWSGLSIQEVEKILLLKNCGLFLLLDDEGIRTQTIIVAKHAIDRTDPNADELMYLPEYNKVRVPWDEAHLMWCNLNIANMDFEDFCVEVTLPKSKEFWWTYDEGLRPSDEQFEAVVEKREKVIKEMEKLDLA